MSSAKVCSGCPAGRIAICVAHAHTIRINFSGKLKSHRRGRIIFVELPTPIVSVPSAIVSITKNHCGIRPNRNSRIVSCVSKVGHPEASPCTPNEDFSGVFRQDVSLDSPRLWQICVVRHEQLRRRVPRTVGSAVNKSSAAVCQSDSWVWVVCAWGQDVRGLVC